MFKHVVGVGDVEMTAAEIKAIRAEWAVNDAKVPDTAPENPVQRLAEFLRRNPDIKDLVEG